MDRQVLESYLSTGMSLQAIGERTGKHPSTVGYWLRKHELAAVHREKYAPKGGIPEAALKPLVEAAFTLSEMALELGVSVATVRYWLERHELSRAATKTSPSSAPKPKEVVRLCPTHGESRFVLEGRGYYRCGQCRLHAVAEWRRRTKAKLVAEKGGRCLACGYDRYPGALQFHHLDPTTKEFSLSMRGLTRSLERIRTELSKCILLCANCHAEVEAGLIEPGPPPTSAVAQAATRGGDYSDCPDPR